MARGAEGGGTTSWRRDRRGVRAGGDPCGSRRSVSIQNHASRWVQQHHHPSPEGFRPDGPRDCVMFSWVGGRSGLCGADADSSCTRRRRTGERVRRESGGQVVCPTWTAAQLHSCLPKNKTSHFFREVLFPGFSAVSMVTAGCKMFVTRWGEPPPPCYLDICCLWTEHPPTLIKTFECLFKSLRQTRKAPEWFHWF